jgi:hypothetical protein
MREAFLSIFVQISPFIDVVLNQGLIVMARMDLRLISC